jgi:hypothetical protein
LKATSRLIVDLISAKRASKLIVIYSKRSLYFREDCGIFCEGEWEQQRHLNGHTGLVDFIGLVGLIRLIGLVDFISDVGLVGLNGCANLIDLQPTHDLVDHYGVIGRADLIILIKIVGYNGQISLVSLIDRISLVILNGFIGHISFIGLSIVGFVGLSLVSLGGLISHSSLVGRCIIGLIDLLALSNHWPIGFIGVISLGLIALSASTASLARRLIVSSLTHRLFCERIATAINEATKTTWWLKQAAALGVATVRLSANEIANVASTYYLIASSFHVHLLVREKMWWWLALARKKLCWWLASFGESYHGDVLQHAKHLFSLRLPQMTKYCVMRECDNIHSWISISGDLAFSHQHEIYGFKFPKRFLEISSRDLTLL